MCCITPRSVEPSGRPPVAFKVSAAEVTKMGRGASIPARTAKTKATILCWSCPLRFRRISSLFPPAVWNVREVSPCQATPGPAAQFANLGIGLHDGFLNQVGHCHTSLYRSSLEHTKITRTHRL